MIDVVYGYLVKHGGVGRYLKEVLPLLRNLGKVRLLSIENEFESLKVPRTKKIKCIRDTSLFSVSENLSFSSEVEKQRRFGSILHSHGIYNLDPTVYTAHICLGTYLSDVRRFSGEKELLFEAEQLLPLEKRVVSNSEVLTAVSQKVANEISERYNIDRDRIKVIRGSSRLRKEREHLKKNEDLTLGFVGGNLVAKGIGVLVEAANILRMKRINLKVIGVGTNKTIEDYFLKNALFDYELRGRIDLKGDFFDSLDFYVCPSLYDSFSLSTLEAMALEVPVISSDLNGVFYDNPRESLLRLDTPPSAEQLADLILAARSDKKRLDEAVISGSRIVSKDSWESIATSYDAVYEQFK